MEHLRLLLAIVLTIMVFVMWELFFAPQRPEHQPGAPKQSETLRQQEPSAEKSGRSAEKDVPATEAKEPQAHEQVDVPTTRFKTITVENRLYRAQISEKGAAVRLFVLKQYREGPGDEAPAKVLVTEKNSAGTALVRFAGSGMPDVSDALFTTDVDSDHLKVTTEERTLSFYWKAGEDFVLEKRYRFYPDSYKIGLTINLINQSENRLPADLFLEMTNVSPGGGGTFRSFAFQGPFAYIDKKLEEIDPGDIEDKSVYAGNVHWTGITDRYFMTALVPESPVQTEIRLSRKENPDLIRVAYLQPGEAVEPGGSRQLDYELFMGPKRMSELKQFGHELDRAIDFGFFDVIAKPCLWLMNKIHDNVVSNYGVAIILLTILVKIIFWPLGNKSYRSMAEMKKLQPLMADIRKKYKDDKKKMNEEVMRLYKTYKVNPMSGCLPMVVQIPVFIAFYRMLYEAIELRHAPFMLWINDLSSPDRLFRFDISIPFMAAPYGIPVLTIIMGATMFLQQKLSPPPGDPSQAKIMMLMPLIFTVIFINFPAGLVLYWLTNNVLSIAQQYYVTRKTA
ncbi:MAG: membrane protein insertase YidC [Desulfobacteraceae bacterium]|nr:membrane protein insertase YidC [Desulfobacteraceae bacterium]